MNNDGALGYRIREVRMSVDLLDGLPTAIPKLSRTNKYKGDLTVYARFVNLRLGWEWFVTEFDGQNTFRGLVTASSVEYGPFYASELEAAGCQLDPNWQLRPVSVVRAKAMQIRRQNELDHA